MNESQIPTNENYLTNEELESIKSFMEQRLKVILRREVGKIEGIIIEED